MSIQVISFTCTLKNKVGQLISSTFNKEVLTSSQGQPTMLDGLAKGLQDMTTGESRTITLSAEQAYGFYEPNKVILYPKSKLSRHLRLGDTVQIVSKTGNLRVYKATQFHGDMVSLDGNHPLAGQDLIFDVVALAVRDATASEIEDSTNTVSTQVLH